MHDVDEIRRLTHEYAFFFDTGDVDAWIGLFAEDAILDFSPANGARTAGHDDLLAYATAAKARPGASSHLIMNHIVDVDEDTAHGICYAAVYQSDAAQVTRVVVGYYADRYVRAQSGRWQFAERVFRPFLST